MTQDLSQMSDDAISQDVSYEELKEFLADARDLRWCFRDSGLKPKMIQLALGAHEKETPYVVFDHTTYPQVEVHLFTIADSELWVQHFVSCYHLKRFSGEKTPSTLSSPEPLIQSGLSILVNQR